MKCKYTKVMYLKLTTFVKAINEGKDEFENYLVKSKDWK